MTAVRQMTLSHRGLADRIEPVCEIPRSNAAALGVALRAADPIASQPSASGSLVTGNDKPVVVLDHRRF